MRDIVALDLDAVLAQTDLALRDFIADKYNICPDWSKINHFKIENMAFLSPDQQKEILDAIYTGSLLENVLPHNYAEHATKKLRNENFEVYIITSRPTYLREMTINWLRKHDIYCNELYMVEDSEKHRVLKNHDIKAFIEDRFDILESVLDNYKLLEYGLYVVTHPWNKRHNNDQIVRVDDVAIAVDRIINFRRWKGFFLTKCVGDIDKFIKEYKDGKG
jgi:uncharacterized HAD superfamily protein